MNKTNSFEWLQREKFHVKFDEFQIAAEKSKKECGDLPKIEELLFMLACTLVAFSKIPSVFDENRIMIERYSQSLLFHCFIELFRISSCNIFLTACGLYKNVYHNIRFTLESMVQTSYMDSRHPHVEFPTKIEILKEVEDLPRYRGVQLLKSLKIDNKEQIMREYRKIKEEYESLSRKVHFTYRQLLMTSKDFEEYTLRSTKVDCSEARNIYDSMRTVYDFFFLLFLTYFPEVKKPLTENKEFVKTVKDHNLRLLCKMLRI